MTTSNAQSSLAQEEKSAYTVPGEQPSHWADEMSALDTAVTEYVDAITEVKLSARHSQYQGLHERDTATAWAHKRLIDAAYALATRRAEARYAAETTPHLIWTASCRLDDDPTVISWFASLDGETWYPTLRQLADAEVEEFRTDTTDRVEDLGNGKQRIHTRFSYARRFLTHTLCAEVFDPVGAPS